MRAALALAVAIAVAATTACGGTGSNTASVAAIHAVASSQRWGSYADSFPQVPRSRSCTIRGGGPPPGIRIPGVCSTVVQVRQDGSALVRFVRSWDSRDFHGVGDPTGRLSHAWRFEVSPSGRVTFVGRSGDVSPAEIP